MQLTSQSVPGALGMTYTYEPGQNNGRIINSQDGTTGENTNYTYDALNRLTAASNSQWSEGYTYDGFGNLTSKTGSGGSPNPALSMTTTYNANNQATGQGQGYDGNGNPTYGGWWPNNYSYTYTIENRLASEAQYGGPTTMYAYDRLGKRVMSESDPTLTYTFYGITGQKLATLKCDDSDYPLNPTCAIVGQNVYFGKKLIAAGGVPVATARLGSVRANSQGERFAYYPYGEERSSTVDGREKFATYFRDTVGQDYADQRYYDSGTAGFWSPDTSGAASLKNPRSWNRFAYAGGDPVNFRDPSGQLYEPTATDCINDPEFCEEWDRIDARMAGDCEPQGAYFFDDFFDSSWFSSTGVGCVEDGGDDEEGPAAPPATVVSLRGVSACTEAQGTQTGNFTLDITYQVMVNGAAVTSAAQLYNFGTYFISEQLTNPTGTMGTSGANWCLGIASASCPYPGQVGSLLPNGTFVDELSGQGTLTQSFHMNGAGSPLQVAFGPLTFIGPLQSYTVLNNTYNSRGRPPGVTVAGGAFSSVGAPPCKK